MVFVTAPIAVTGSTGRLGGRVARLLAGQGVAQRLVVRDASRAPDLGAEICVATYADAPAVEAALAGVETALMVSGAEEPDRVASHTTFVDAAVRAGVKHLVYISFYGAAPDATFTLARDHYATEEHIKASGLAWTFLRDNIYLDFVPLFAGEDGVIRGPAGDGRFAAVAQDDIADCVVAVLLDPEAHSGRTYSLTGPEAISLDEAAAVLTEKTGRTVTYRDETIEEAYRSREKYNAPQWQVDAWVSTYTAIAAGELAAVTHDVEFLCGHRATSLRELLDA